MLSEKKEMLWHLSLGPWVAVRLQVMKVLAYFGLAEGLKVRVLVS